MAVYYKFKSAKDFDSIPIDGHFISVANLKEKIFESKHLGRGTDFDLMVANAQTNEEYQDEATLIPKNTSVLVRRVPGRPRMTIVTEPEEKKSVEDKVEEAQPAKNNFSMADSSVRMPEENEWDEFGNDLYAIPEVLPVQSGNPVMDALPPSRADEDSKIKALMDTTALDWQRQTQEGFGAGRGYGRGVGGRMMGPGRGFGRGVAGGGLERKTPPPGYTCHRCKTPGHFIQHCPTNGDPNYDIKRVKPPTGIPKSMLMATPDGSYALPSGAVAVLKPNEAAFEKEIEGLPSTTRSVSDLPPELRCPLCKEVMKDAVLTSKCCFKSFCDKCIRDHIISKLVCICGATNVLADDLLPNKTLRDTINRILESDNVSAENGGSILQIHDMESARSAPFKVPSPTASAASKGEQLPLQCKVETQKEVTAVNVKHEPAIPQQSSEKGKATKAVSEATSVSVKEPALQGNAPPAEEEVQQKLPFAEPVKKKKKKKAVLPINGADMQWRTPQDLGYENHMMPFPPAACNPYWGGMPLGMEGYMGAPYMGNMGNMGNIPYMGYNPGPFDVPFGGMIPQDPFGGQGYMMPVVPPQRDLAEIALGSSQAPPIMSREEFEARKADLRRKREMERRSEREYFNDRESGSEMSNSGDISSLKTKSHQRPSNYPSSLEPQQSQYSRQNHQHHRSEKPPLSNTERVAPPLQQPREANMPARSGKRQLESEEDAAAEAMAADKRHKASVFSRISFPELNSSNPPIKKKKSSSSSTSELPSTRSSNGYKDYDPPATSSTHSHHHHRSSSHHHHQRDESKSVSAVISSSRKSSSLVVDQDSSDEDRHFKRRPSRYEPPPPPIEDEVVAVRSSRRSRERDHYEREHRHSKHR
ncbi:hypothetical protein C5167_020746 [Papaver somniferum]|uniref:DWNN domain-containing protein n=1 Tax=Papaver somniferum TaxID=3469 RepID=A0A4Y7ITV6_PAPSO|nr:E3 ubiquitin ligase PARAQUAT TOLERANCE 3-like [Papaver somniferum]RZC52323.1 hypothetical protein C5167_020746 [Papaver somniferum]